MVNELERCKSWIKGALSYCDGTHTWDDIANGIASGAMQLWPAPKGLSLIHI